MFAIVCCWLVALQPETRNFRYTQHQLRLTSASASGLTSRQTILYPNRAEHHQASYKHPQIHLPLPTNSPVLDSHPSSKASLLLCSLTMGSSRRQMEHKFEKDGHASVLRFARVAVTRCRRRRCRRRRHCVVVKCSCCRPFSTVRRLITPTTCAHGDHHGRHC